MIDPSKTTYGERSAHAPPELPFVLAKAGQWRLGLRQGRHAGRGLDWSVRRQLDRLARKRDRRSEGVHEPFTVTIKERLIVEAELMDEVFLENERSLQHMK
jgi:hypothetical protein